MQTMFEDVSGFGAWQRLYFCLEGGHLLYWSHPNEMGDTVGSFKFNTAECVNLLPFLLTNVFLYSFTPPAIRWQFLSLWLLQRQTCEERMLCAARHV